MSKNIILCCILCFLASLPYSLVFAINEPDSAMQNRQLPPDLKRFDKGKILKEEAEGKKESLGNVSILINVLDPLPTIRSKLEPIAQTNLVAKRIESPILPNRVENAVESERGEKKVEGETGNEAQAEKEVTNEDVVRRRKLERRRFGEAQYVDYPEETAAEGKEGENKERTERKKAIRETKRTLELLDGIAEVGQGIVLFAKVGAEG